MKKKFELIIEDWNSGLPEEEILEKYKIKKHTLQVYLSKARKKGIEVKARARERETKPKYMQVAEDWNNGLSEQEILEKYKIKKSNLQEYLSKARKKGIEVKAREKAKPKYVQVVEDFNNGLSEEKMLEKYKIKKLTLQIYLSKAKKEGIEVKAREKAKPRYMQVVEDWNNGLSEEEILEKYNIKKSNLQVYLSKAKKEGIEVKAREKAKPKYIQVTEDWNNGLPEETILEKYKIKKSNLKIYLSKAGKKGIEVKSREKAKTKYIQVTEDWNNGLSEEKMLEKYKIKKHTLQEYLSRAGKKGIEVKSREKAKPKYIQVTEDWNNGLSEEKILEKYKIKKSNLQVYLSKARKKGIEVKSREKAKPKYIQVIEDWNNGLPEEKMLEKYKIKKNTLQSYFSKAKKDEIEVKTREKAKPKYIQVIEDWNNELPEEKILEKYKIKKSNLQVYLSKVRKKGIKVKARVKAREKTREKAKPKYIQIAEDLNSGLTEEEILAKYKIKSSTLKVYLSKAKNVIPEPSKERENKVEKTEFPDNKKSTREVIKDSLKLYMPRQVAQKLKISSKAVFDVLDSLTPEEAKEVNKAFIRNRPYVFSRVKKLKKEGKSVLEALKSVDSNIPLHLLTQLQEVYYNLGLYSHIEKSINKKLYLDESISEKEKEFLKGLKENMHLEVISVQIRKRRKEALEKGREISYERLCREYNVRTSFIIDLLGREEKDY